MRFTVHADTDAETLTVDGPTGVLDGDAHVQALAVVAVMMLAHPPTFDRVLSSINRQYRMRDGEWMGEHSAVVTAPCDHCGESVHRDINGWWVGSDETSDCGTSLRGHEVEGTPR